MSGGDSEKCLVKFDETARRERCTYMCPAAAKANPHTTTKKCFQSPSKSNLIPIDKHTTKANDENLINFNSVESNK